MKLHGVALLVALLPMSPLLSCGGAASSAAKIEAELEPAPAFVELPGVFSPEAAWRHLRAFAEIGPRVSGSLGAAEARGYIERELAAAGARLVALPAPGAPAAPEAVAAAAPEAAAVPAAPPAPALPPDAMLAPEPVNVLAEIPGESQDLILLMAPYDSRALPDIRFLGLNDGASGAAVLLELARVLAAKPLPYTTWLLFLDGEAAGSDGEPGLRGSRAFAAQARTDGSLSRMRLALYTNRVCDADLRVARDLLSHRQYRDAFWDAALRLGVSDHFEQDAFQSPKAGHLALRAAGFVQIVALQDTSFGGGEPPGAFANSEQDDLEHCAPESLEIVGRVILEGLDGIGARLRKIDRFASSPMAQFREEWSRSLEAQAVAAPASPPASTPGTPAGE